MMKINKNNWSFCELCDTVSYQFECCGNVSCNAMGCEVCQSHHQIIEKMIREGKHPPIEDLPVRSKKEDIEKFFGKQVFFNSRNV